jgi:phosphoribosylaminoimidazole carboxylase (NCAIR synthetase)
MKTITKTFENESEYLHFVIHHYNKNNRAYDPKMGHCCYLAPDGKNVL